MPPGVIPLRVAPCGYEGRMVRSHLMEEDTCPVHVEVLPDGHGSGRLAE